MQGLKEYQDNADGVLIERFVAQHSTLVKKIALHLKKKLPSYIELDDLLQSGIVGLLESKRTYKQDMGASFETYASIRIRGSIIDSLRKNSWISRDAVKNMRRISTVISEIEQRNQRQATTDEIIEHLGVSVEDYFKMTQEINVYHTIKFDEINIEKISTEDDVNPENILLHENMKANLQAILPTLPEKEQIVLSLYYVEEFTLKQIAEVLDLTEARICQLHAQAIARVRHKMNIK